MYITTLSSYQNRFWQESYLNPESSAYNTPMVYKLQGELNIEALQRSLEIFVHVYDEGCRSSFHYEGEQVYRQVVDKVDVELDLVSIDFLTDSGTTLEQWILDRTMYIFKLDTPPLFKFSLLSVNTEEYILILNFPHIISDAFSAVYINRSLTQIYNQIIEGKEPVPPELPDFSKYLSEDSHYKTSTQFEEDIEYWVGMLSKNALGVDFPECSLPSTGWANHRFVIDKTRLQLVKNRAKKSRTTPFIVLSTLYATTLARHYDLNDFVINYPVNVRTTGFKQACGCYVNNVPLLVSFNHTMSLQDAVAKMTKQRIMSKKHQRLPLNEIVSAVRNEDIAVESNVFNACITEAFLTQDDPLSLLKVTSEQITLDIPERPFDLNFAYHITDDGISICIEYNRACLTRQGIADFADTFEHILQAYLQDDTTGIYDVILHGKEQQYQLERFTQGADVERYSENWITQFIAQAAQSEDSIAVRFHQETLSYRELNEKSAKLASYLVEKGVKQGTFVGLFFERSIEMIVAIVSVLRTGSAYVPLDPESPDERLQTIANDAGFTLTLTHSPLNERVPSFTKETVVLDEDLRWQDAPLFEDQVIPSNSLAYVIYTSGSTGVPKGVGNTHCGLYNRLSWHDSLDKFDKRSRVLQKTPYYFDVSVWEILWPLKNGYELIVSPPDHHREPRKLIKLVQEQKVNIMHFVPSMLSAFLEEIDENIDFPYLKTVICSGEALYTEQVAQFYKKQPTVKLYNLYGPTETAIDVSSSLCTPQSEQGTFTSVAPIGMPIDNVSLYILDSNLSPCRTGIPGELYISGKALAQGYVNRPDLTASHFIPDPFSIHPGSRMYKTGDVAMFDRYGVIHYLGRNDEQIKLNGNRIDIREVESCLLSFQGVLLCAVVPVEIQGRIRQLHAYIEWNDECSGYQVECLKTKLSELLPLYMVPERIEKIEKIPLLHTGKINRKLLKKISNDTFSDKRSIIYPKTPFQREIADIWKHVLNVKEISLSDNFFSLGGSSIQVIQLIGKINKNYGLSLSPQILMSSQEFEDFYSEVLMEIAIDARENNKIEIIVDKLSTEDIDLLTQKTALSGGVI